MSADEPYRGMVAYEREAVERALRETRERWLPVLEGRLAKSNDADGLAMLIAEIRRLRRLLGIFQTPEARAPPAVNGSAGTASASSKVLSYGLARSRRPSLPRPSSTS